MTEVASRELRNNTAGVLARVRAGENVLITSRGEPVAQLVPIEPQGKRHWISGAELARRLRASQADSGLRDDLRNLAGDTTDDLGPIR